MEEDDTWKIYGYGGFKMTIMIMHDAPHVSHAVDEEWARTYYGVFLLHGGGVRYILMRLYYV